MPWSDVAIANRALDHLKGGTITSLDDASEAARLCKRNYEAVRDEVLAAYPWNANKRQASLAALTTAPLFKFTRQYLQPADCIAIWRVAGEEFGAKWERQGNLILTDLGPPLEIEYAISLTEAGLFDPELGEAIAHKLASVIAYAITGSIEKEKHQLELYERITRPRAWAADAQEGPGETPEQTSWEEARL